MDFDIGELNPIALAAGLIGGIAVFAMMGYTGDVQIGLFYKVLGLAAGAVAGYVAFSIIMNK